MVNVVAPSSARVHHVPVRQDDWLDKVCPIISERIERYATSEIRFNLMAIIGSRVEALTARQAQLQQRQVCMLVHCCMTFSGVVLLQLAIDLVNIHESSQHMNVVQT